MLPKEKSQAGHAVTPDPDLGAPQNKTGCQSKGRQTMKRKRMLRLGTDSEERVTPHWRPQQEAGFLLAISVSTAVPTCRIWEASAQLCLSLVKEPACPPRLLMPS